MKGATALPCAKTIRAPNKTIMITIGINQYFLRLRINAHNSFKNDMIKIPKTEYD